MKICHKVFSVDFDAIIELCAGFDAYFDKHPEEKADFPRCNDITWYKLPRIKSRDMFIGKKTETFGKILDTMSIELDSAYLEAEYYLTPRGKGRVYEYKNDAYSIAFDFHIDPTAQIECCSIAVSYPKSEEKEIINLIRELLYNSRYVVKRIYDGDLSSLNKQLNAPSKYNLFNKLRHSSTMPIVINYLKIALRIISFASFFIYLFLALN